MVGNGMSTLKEAQIEKVRAGLSTCILVHKERKRAVYKMNTLLFL